MTNISGSVLGASSVPATAGTCLIGYTGFVGGNLLRQFPFQDLYNSANIHQIKGRSYQLLVCAAPSAAKWKANQSPQQDRDTVDRLADALAGAHFREAVLISTVDVYPEVRDVDESQDCGGGPAHAYGRNRLHLEKRLREIAPELSILRLPGVFGPGLKKNILFDLLHDNCLDAINPLSAFQYYDISELWRDLTIVRERGLPLVNLAVEPIPTSEILGRFFPGRRVGWNPAPPVSYNMQTMYARIFGETGRYRFNADEVLHRLGRFLRSHTSGAAA